MKRKEAKQEKCRKCNKYFYVHDHHILPKSIFGEGEKVVLCPNCHTHFHEYLNKQDVNEKDVSKYLYHWYNWYYTIVVIVVLGLIIKLLI